MCDRFPAMTPFDVRRERGWEVMLLIQRLYKHNINQRGKKRSKLRRPAGDDWF